MNLSEQIEGQKTKGDLWNLLVVFVVSIVLAGRLFRLISRYAVNIFFYDQWDFNIMTLFQKHSLWEIFLYQPGPQRQGLGGVLAKLIEPHFQWNSRTESFLVGGIIAAATILALYLKRRLYGSFSVFDALIPAIFLTPRQYESIFVAANVARDSLPLLLIMLYCLAWSCRRGLLRYALVLLINFLAIYTGFGIFVGVLTPVLLVLDFKATPQELPWSKAYLVGALTVSLASLGSFFLRYRYAPGLDCFSYRLQSPVAYGAYMAVMFANFLGILGTGTLPIIAGTGVLIVLLGSLAAATLKLLKAETLHLSHQDWRQPLLATALIAYGLMFSAATAYGRLCGGLWTAVASRYVILLEPGLLGLYFYLLGFRRTLARGILLSTFLAVMLTATWHFNKDISYFPNMKRQWRNCYLQTEDIEKCDQLAGGPIYPSDTPQRAHLQEKLQYLKKTHQNLYSDSKP